MKNAPSCPHLFIRYMPALILLYFFNSAIAQAREKVSDFFDIDEQVSKVNLYCQDGCFDIGSKYEKEWLVEKIELTAETSGDTILLNVRQTFGRILPNQPETFDATEPAQEYVADLSYVILKRGFGFGTVISLDADCNNASSERCKSIGIFLSGSEPRRVDAMEWDMEVLAAMAKGWSRQDTYDHFCLPPPRNRQIGDYEYDWCENAKMFNLLQKQNEEVEKIIETRATTFETTEDAIDFVRNELEKECDAIETFDGLPFIYDPVFGELKGETNRRNPVIDLEDISGNGIWDIIVSLRLKCDGDGSKFCGPSGFCNQGYVFVYNYNSVDKTRFKLTSLKPGHEKPNRSDRRLYGYRSVVFEPSGACGPSGYISDRCQAVREWDGTEFAYIGSKLGNYVWYDDLKEHFRIVEAKENGKVYSRRENLDYFGEEAFDAN